MRFEIVGVDGPSMGESPTLMPFVKGLEEVLTAEGDEKAGGEGSGTKVVFNFFPPDRPRPHHRGSQATFVVGITAGPEPEGDILQAVYPMMIRSLGNHLIYLVEPIAGNGVPRATYFVTLERGYYPLEDCAPEDYFHHVLDRVRPLAESRLVINNEFREDLPPGFWEGNERTQEIVIASRRMAEMDLLPAPFPMETLLPEKDFLHLKRLFQIGGLSYGNVSVREPGYGFWMSASGVDKSRLEHVGRDILLVRDYDEAHNQIILSVPPDISPRRRVSVDAIEHWMIYRRHPGVGAILHVHAWMEGVVSTEINYPCGTYEIARAVSDALATVDDPVHGVIGLRNHGLTITGEKLPEIFDRVGPHLLRQVPMS